jgi:hypothetical protein
MRLAAYVAVALLCGCMGEPTYEATTTTVAPTASTLPTMTSEPATTQTEPPTSTWPKGAFDRPTTTVGKTYPTYPVYISTTTTLSTTAGFDALFERAGRLGRQTTTSSSTTEAKPSTSTTTTTIEGITAPYQNKYGGKYNAGGRPYNWTAPEKACHYVGDSYYCTVE